MLFLTACAGEDGGLNPRPVEKTRVTGTLEKGPFTAGSQVTLYELDANLAQTGKSFRTTTTGDLGHFTFDSPINLASQYVELEISGYFYNETTGELSDSQVTLRALADLSARNEVNVNLLTHLEYTRVKTLIREGASFAKAKAQADREMLRVFAITDAISTPEDISLTDGTDEAQILLAVSSTMLQGRSEAEFTELLAKFSTEFAASGTVTSTTLLDEIHDSQSKLHPSEIAERMETYYADKGTELRIDDFSAFVDFNGDGVINADDEEFLDSEPNSPVHEDELFQTEENVKAAIAGCYMNIVAFTSRQLYLEAVRTNQVQANPQSLFTPQSDEMQELWERGWNVIANANVILNVLKDKSLSFPVESYIAETEAIRAFTYYNMAQLWGDLPLRDESTANDPVALGSKPKEEVLRHLLERVQASADNMSEDVEYGLASHWMARMLEAEIRLELKDYDAAANALREVTECGRFSFQPESDFYNQQTPETIFALYVAYDDLGGFNSSLQKGEFQPVYRYATALLMYAEAMNRLGRTAEAIDALRRLGYEGEAGDASATDHAIATMWKSLIGPDYGYWALLKRLGLAVELLGIETYQQLFPIPLEELMLNPGMTQNPGY